MAVFRVFVKKKNKFAVEARKLKQNLEDFLGIRSLNQIQIFNRYDIIGIDSKTFDSALNGILCDVLVDDVFFSLPCCDHVFGVKFLSGQYDARADFCEQCINLVDSSAYVRVKTAKFFCFFGRLTEQELEKVKTFLINPVECEEADVDEKISFNDEIELNDEVEVLKDFNSLNEEQLKNFLFENSLVMDLADLKFCQSYFKKIERRPPTFAEIKVIDTYWSDHCRHTTFLTNLQNIQIVDSNVKQVFDLYLKVRHELKIENRPISLMDLATVAAKKLRSEGRLNEVEQSDEINACSVEVKVKTAGKFEDWFLVFKNETHNHPTEIEPFGGAATCIGGAIRDPLSARAYVFQAMRVTGAANPITPFEQTLKGKLPQSKIVKVAAEGYSSYGNQIGVATGFVQEIYHPGYVAKRMEIGAVVGAVLKKNVVKKKPESGDVVVLIGGKTGRDGCGGATGSSVLHNEFSMNMCGAQVQKGNPVEERKLQRFFRNERVSRLIKRCNDFGAGGVCVAVGELADGLRINLNAVFKKYEGLNAIELAISESQERMAVVVAKDDLKIFLRQAEAENLMAAEIAKVENSGRLTMVYSGKKVVDLSRDFLSSNGTEKQMNVKTNLQSFSLKFNFENIEQGWFDLFSRLNVCSQKGLVEMFDSTIGGGCVLMPYGGKFQTTKIQAMVSRFPTENICETVSIMSFGFNPFMLDQSPFFGAQYAVIESIAKLVASGGCVEKCWLTFQEYFPSLKNDELLWGQPFLALLGAFNAQMKLKIASIGGKDSMSGTFENLHVPSTLVSFAVGVAENKNIISPEFKNVGSEVALVLPQYDSGFAPNYESIMKIFLMVERLIEKKLVVSAYAVGVGGIAKAIATMSFGNRIGFAFSDDFDEKNFEFEFYGGFVLELCSNFSSLDLNGEFKSLNIIGKTISEFYIEQKNFKVDLNVLQSYSKNKLEKIYSTKAVSDESDSVETISCFEKFEKKWPSIKRTNVRVFVPVFPGTNCEFDVIKKFEIAGAVCDSFVVNNLTGANILESVKIFVEKLKSCQIVALSGGFSAGDEPDGSAKFIAAFFRNDLIRNEIEKFLNLHDGLMIGICNGFQALAKLGLLEYGKITDAGEVGATLTYNRIGRHQSKWVRTRICCNRSPWLWNVEVGQVFGVPVSHGEGRFFATNETLQKLRSNNQIAMQYVDFEGKASMEIEHNPNGSILAVEAVLSPNGRIIGKMGHSERVFNGLFKNLPDVEEHRIFEAGVNYFKKL